MLSKQLETTLNLALSIANNNKHEYTTLEHLLLALLEDKDALSVLTAHKVDISDLRRALEYYISHELDALRNEDSYNSKPTAGFQRVVHSAVVHGNAIGIERITGANLLAEFFFEHESYAVTCLKEYNITRANVISSLAHESAVNIGFAQDGVTKHQEIYDQSPQIKQTGATTTSKSAERAETAIASYCVNLNYRAKLGFIDVLVGREREIERTIEILCRRQKNNAILVGEAGVGKTAIAEGLALRIVNDAVPQILKNFTIYSLDFGSMVAGARYRGDFEERVKELVEELKGDEKAILFIDEIHTMIGAGASMGSSLDASNLLKPSLARGEIRCIGSTTFKEYKNHFEKDAALARRFQKVVIEEPDEETSIRILHGLKSRYEKHHNVIYDDEALRAAVHLSERYISDRRLPDKAIDLMDEAGVRRKISGSKTNIVTARDIEAIVSVMMHLPNIVVTSNDTKQIQKLECNLKTVIFGQDVAIGELCSSIKLSKAGLRNHDKPTGCYLFTGPTGVGKTELANQLAKFCNMKLIRFDMSEYTESHTVSRLIGTPPGYVGFDQGGLLTEAVTRAPYSVILFDEIEKANHEIFNLLLQVMDYGKLTDSTGKIVNFSHSIIIMTSNVGAEESSGIRIGFGNGVNSREAASIEAVTQIFSPEFRSRLDSIVVFNPLDDNIISMIVEKELQILAAQLADRCVKMVADKSVKSYLSKYVFNNKNGARAISRVIDTELKQKIADEILFGKLSVGGSIYIKYTEDGIQFEFKPIKTSKRKPPELEPILVSIKNDILVE